MTPYQFWLPDDTLDRTPASDHVRRAAGLPIPPALPDGDWWSCYQLVERALLRFRRAVAALPPASARRAALDALWPQALAQLGVVTALCVEGSRTRIPKRNPRRLARRRRRRTQRRLLAEQLAAVVVAVERFGDVAARVAFAEAVDTATADLDANLRQAEEALAGVTAALDELTALTREALDP